MRFPLGVVLACALLIPTTADASVLVHIDKSRQRMSVSVDGWLRHTWSVSTGRAGFGLRSRHRKPWRRHAAQDREELMRSTGLVSAAALALALAAPAVAQQKLKFAHVYETSEPYHTEMVWAAGEIKKRTKDKFEVQVFPASALGNEQQINQALPLGTIDYQLPPGVPRVSTFASKWDVESEIFQSTPGVYPADFDPDVAERIRRLAAAAFEAVGCRDYARTDMRVGRNGELYVLEVNPNPSLIPDWALARAAALAGWPYAKLIQRFVKNAEERGPLSALPRSG